MATNDQLTIQNIHAISTPAGMLDIGSYDFHEYVYYVTLYDPINQIILSTSTPSNTLNQTSFQFPQESSFPHDLLNYGHSTTRNVSQLTHYQIVTLQFYRIKQQLFHDDGIFFGTNNNNIEHLTNNELSSFYNQFDCQDDPFGTDYINNSIQRNTNDNNITPFYEVELALGLLAPYSVHHTYLLNQLPKSQQILLHSHQSTYFILKPTDIAAIQLKTALCQTLPGMLSRQYQTPLLLLVVEFFLQNFVDNMESITKLNAVQPKVQRQRLIQYKNKARRGIKKITGTVQDLSAVWNIEKDDYAETLQGLLLAHESILSIRDYVATSTTTLTSSQIKNEPSSSSSASSHNNNSNNKSKTRSAIIEESSSPMMIKTNSTVAEGYELNNPDLLPPTIVITPLNPTGVINNSNNNNNNINNNATTQQQFTSHFTTPFGTSTTIAGSAISGASSIEPSATTSIANISITNNKSQQQEDKSNNNNNNTNNKKTTINKKSTKSETVINMTPAYFLPSFIAFIESKAQKTTAPSKLGQLLTIYNDLVQLYREEQQKEYQQLYEQQQQQQQQQLLEQQQLLQQSSIHSYLLPPPSSQHTGDVDNTNNNGDNNIAIRVVGDNSNILGVGAVSNNNNDQNNNNNNNNNNNDQNNTSITLDIDFTRISGDGGGVGRHRGSAVSIAGPNGRPSSAFGMNEINSNNNNNTNNLQNTTENNINLQQQQNRAQNFNTGLSAGANNNNNNNNNNQHTSTFSHIAQHSSIFNTGTSSINNNNTIVNNTTNTSTNNSRAGSAIDNNNNNTIATTNNNNNATISSDITQLLDVDNIPISTRSRATHTTIVDNNINNQNSNNSNTNYQTGNNNNNNSLFNTGVSSSHSIGNDSQKSINSLSTHNNNQNNNQNNTHNISINTTTAISSSNLSITTPHDSIGNNIGQFNTTSRLGVGLGSVGSHTVGSLNNNTTTSTTRQNLLNPHRTMKLNKLLGEDDHNMINNNSNNNGNSVSFNTMTFGKPNTNNTSNNPLNSMILPTNNSNNNTNTNTTTIIGPRSNNNNTNTNNNNLVTGIIYEEPIEDQDEYDLCESTPGIRGLPGSSNHNNQQNILSLNNNNTLPSSYNNNNNNNNNNNTPSSLILNPSMNNNMNSGPQSLLASYSTQQFGTVVALPGPNNNIQMQQKIMQNLHGGNNNNSYNNLPFIDNHGDNNNTNNNNNTLVTSTTQMFNNNSINNNNNMNNNNNLINTNPLSVGLAALVNGKAGNTGVNSNDLTQQNIQFTYPRMNLSFFELYDYIFFSDPKNPPTWAHAWPNKTNTHSILQRASQNYNYMNGNSGNRSVIAGQRRGMLIRTQNNNNNNNSRLYQSNLMKSNINHHDDDDEDEMQMMLKKVNITDTSMSLILSKSLLLQKMRNVLIMLYRKKTLNSITQLLITRSNILYSPKSMQMLVDVIPLYKRQQLNQSQNQKINNNNNLNSNNNTNNNNYNINSRQYTTTPNNNDIEMMKTPASSIVITYLQKLLSSSTTKINNNNNTKNNINSSTNPYKEPQNQNVNVLLNTVTPEMLQQHNVLTITQYNNLQNDTKSKLELLSSKIKARKKYLDQQFEVLEQRELLYRSHSAIVINFTEHITTQRERTYNNILQNAQHISILLTYQRKRVIANLSSILSIRTHHVDICKQRLAQILFPSLFQIPKNSTDSLLNGSDTSLTTDFMHGGSKKQGRFSSLLGSLSLLSSTNSSINHRIATATAASSSSTSALSSNGTTTAVLTSGLNTNGTKGGNTTRNGNNNGNNGSSSNSNNNNNSDDLISSGFSGNGGNHNNAIFIGHLQGHNSLLMKEYTIFMQHYSLYQLIYGEQIFSICGIPLFLSPLILNLDTTHDLMLQTSLGLGYIVQLIALISNYLNIKLPFVLHCNGPKSGVFFNYPDRSTILPLYPYHFYHPYSITSSSSVTSSFLGSISSSNNNGTNGGLSGSNNSTVDVVLNQIITNHLTNSNTTNSGSNSSGNIKSTLLSPYRTEKENIKMITNAQFGHGIPLLHPSDITSNIMLNNSIFTTTLLGAGAANGGNNSHTINNINNNNNHLFHSNMNGLMMLDSNGQQLISSSSTLQNQQQLLQNQQQQGQQNQQQQNQQGLTNVSFYPHQGFNTNINYLTAAKTIVPLIDSPHLSTLTYALINTIFVYPCLQNQNNNNTQQQQQQRKNQNIPEHHSMSGTGGGGGGNSNIPEDLYNSVSTLQGQSQTTATTTNLHYTTSSTSSSSLLTNNNINNKSKQNINNNNTTEFTHSSQIVQNNDNYAKILKKFKDNFLCNSFHPYYFIFYAIYLLNYDILYLISVLYQSKPFLQTISGDGNAGEQRDRNNLSVLISSTNNNNNINNNNNTNGQASTITTQHTTTHINNPTASLISSHRETTMLDLLPASLLVNDNNNNNNNNNNSKDTLIIDRAFDYITPYYTQYIQQNDPYNINMHPAMLLKNLQQLIQMLTFE